MSCLYKAQKMDINTGKTQSITTKNKKKVGWWKEIFAFSVVLTAGAVQCFDYDLTNIIKKTRGYFNYGVKIVNNLKTISEYYSIFVDPEKLYANFRCGEFELKKRKAPDNPDLEAILGKLNPPYKLEDAKTLFYLVRANKEIPNLEKHLGERFNFNHPAEINPSLQPGETYFFPAYTGK